LVQTILPIRPAYLFHFSRNAADHFDPQFLGMIKQIRTQGPADQGIHSPFPEQFQPLARVQVRDTDFLPQPLIGRILRKQVDAGTPIQHRSNPGPQHGYGEHDLLWN
jgi:hypothetical protein